VAPESPAADAGSRDTEPDSDPHLPDVQNERRSGSLGKITATPKDPDSEDVDSVAFGPGGTTLADDRNGNTYL
jgi:hypothetical protein